MTKTRLPGKDAPLEDSIARLQRLLKSAGFNIEEISWLNPAPNCWSVHIRDRNCPLLFTNGKGRNRKAALASALGEFFERLSTLYFFADYWFGDDHDRVGFSHHPDEKWFPLAGDRWPEGLLDEPALRDFYDPEGELAARNLIDLNTGDHDKGICALPFVRQRDQKPVWFPVNIIGNLYVSNGMSAGNTRDEARVQALSEIFERAIKFRIIAEGIALPDIPESVLSRYPHIEAAVKSLREHGFSVVLKDASLGGNYPVINVTLLNPQDGSCFASFGAHPRFEVALERTVTELLQGRDLDQLKGFSTPSFDLDEVADPLNLETHFIDSSGLISWEFFRETPDFDFIDRNFEGTTAEEFDWLCGILHDEGRDIYIQDYDHLGVDACRIIVPGVSEIYPAGDLVWSNNNAAVHLRERLADITLLDRTDLARLHSEFEAERFDPQHPVAAMIGVAADPGSKWETLRAGELSLRLALSSQDHQGVLEQLDWIIDFHDSSDGDTRLWRCLGDMIEMGEQSAAFRRTLEGLYGNETVALCRATLDGADIMKGLDNPVDSNAQRQLMAALDKARARSEKGAPKKGASE